MLEGLGFKAIDTKEDAFGKQRNDASRQIIKVQCSNLKVQSKIIMFKSQSSKYKKPMTEQQALLKLTTLCTQAEHCSQEMIDKMKKWNCPKIPSPETGIPDREEIHRRRTFRTLLYQRQDKIQQVGTPEGGTGAVDETYSEGHLRPYLLKRLKTTCIWKPSCPDEKQI